MNKDFDTTTDRNTTGIKNSDFPSTGNGYQSLSTPDGSCRLQEMSVFFDNRAPVYDEKHVEMLDGGLESKRFMASLLPEHTRTLLDLGIGTGLELAAIFERFPDIEVTGLDISVNMLNHLKEKYPDRKIRLHCANYLNHDLGTGQYDAALSVMSLHHYDHRTKLALYRKIHNSLRSDGLYAECDYMLSEHTYENPEETEQAFRAELARLKSEQNISDEQEYHYDTPCSVANQKRLLLEAGFSCVREVWRQGNTVILVAETGQARNP